MNANLRRIAVAGIAAPALVLTAPALAMADASYEKGYSHADRDGAYSKHVGAHTGDGYGHGHGYGYGHGHHGDGGACYWKEWDHAGPGGAGSGFIWSCAD
ncbi:hypothetical protein [Nocardiopsis trehalosi]|uniref:hypothetical protein n=1 Tax=Nocardiopsis trehalosi TaxID=109329 RepID=UPI00082C637F|nr:hypothetical protein [Nocardiopsis trehalosi]